VPFWTSRVAITPRDLSNLGFNHGARGDRSRVGLDLGVVGHQQDGFEQVVDALLEAGRYRHHHRLAAPLVGRQADLGQLLLHPVGVGVRLVNFVKATITGTRAALAWA
jgi:hypothetical protein